jgi:hypothetical protein
MPVMHLRIVYPGPVRVFEKAGTKVEGFKDVPSVASKEEKEDPKEVEDDGGIRKSLSSILIQC